MDGAGSEVRNNECSGNIGPSRSVGIFALGDHNNITGNHCTNHTSPGYGYGIEVTTNLDYCTVIKNVTSGNGDAGIRVNYGKHYCAENVCSDGLSTSTGVTVGTGDRANVEY